MSGMFTSAQFWAGNPANRRSEYETGIASLLFEKCGKYCVDSDMPGVELSNGE